VTISARLLKLDRLRDAETDSRLRACKFCGGVRRGVLLETSLDGRFFRSTNETLLVLPRTAREGEPLENAAKELCDGCMKACDCRPENICATDVLPDRDSLLRQRARKGGRT
jgi:hypothetical protein